MSGRGQAPKPKTQRVNRHTPTRGEWTTLPDRPYDGPRPTLPRIAGGLAASSKKTWDRWWSSPMAHLWTEGQWEQLVRAIAIEDQTARLLRAGDLRGLSSLLAELRHLEDNLGISEKGRRDLRWRLPTDQDAEVVPIDQAPTKRKLRAVDPNAVART